jgi:hypothetical protein
VAEEERLITIKGYFRWHNLPAVLFLENGEEKAEVFEPPYGYTPIPVEELNDAPEIEQFSFERMVDIDQAIYEAELREAEAGDAKE